MSQENIELFERSVDAYNRRDVDAVLEVLDPEVEWRPALPGLLAEEMVYRGHDGMRQMFHDLFDVLEEIHFDARDFRDKDDLVVAIGEMRVRGKASGAETRSPYANVGEIRNGKGFRIQGYLDPREALEAAGIDDGQE